MKVRKVSQNQIESRSSQSLRRSLRISMRTKPEKNIAIKAANIVKNIEISENKTKLEQSKMSVKVQEELSSEEEDTTVEVDNDDYEDSSICSESSLDFSNLDENSSISPQNSRKYSFKTKNHCKKSKSFKNIRKSKQPSFKTWQQIEELRQMRKQEFFLQATINEIITKHDHERQNHNILLQSYRDQQRVLWERLQMMQKNYSGYRSLVSTLQNVIQLLKNRLREYDVEIDNANEVELFCDHEE